MFVYAVPPSVLPSDAAVIQTPLLPLGIAAVPPHVRPDLVVDDRVPDDPCKLMPLPVLPEMTLAMKPDAAAGFAPIWLFADVADTLTPSPLLGAAVPFKSRPM